MEDLFRFIGVTILMWFCYASGKWSKQNSYEEGLASAQRENDHVLINSYRFYAQRGEYQKAWEFIIFLIRPKGVPIPPTPEPTTGSLVDLALATLKMLEKHPTILVDEAGEIIRDEQAQPNSSGLDALLR
jgi:hypothetical protein